MAARDILDRGMGKAVQRVEVSGEVRSSDPVAECELIEAELARERLLR
jgi:hypothetical protein